MKILANKKIKLLFTHILAAIILSFLLMIIGILIFPKYRLLYILGGCILMSCLITFFLYQYFKFQSEILESAAKQIDNYLLGDSDARLESDEDGELYRLFHEVNTLVSILNAHIENESRAKQSLRDTISDISHQLKTPLAALNIYVGIIQEETKEQPEINKFAELSEQELDRIEILVQNLLKIAKLDAGTISFNRKEENIAEMIHALAKHFSWRCQQEDKLLLLSGDKQLNFICDRTWLLEALSNIIKNALDHTKSGDIIRVEWRQLASIVQISIKDTGCGIHPEDLYHIFKRFYRSRFSKDTKGIGLGLPLAKTIIEAHGGSITVETEQNIGTTFTINFLIATKL